MLPEAGRSESGYRLFDSGAVPRARLVRTLRALGVGLDDVKRVGAAEASLEEELERMADLATLTAEERRRILEDYLDAVVDGQPSPVADRLRAGAPELPDEPSADQVAAWVEVAELLRDPDYAAVWPRPLASRPLSRRCPKSVAIASHSPRESRRAPTAAHP